MKSWLRRQLNWNNLLTAIIVAVAVGIYLWRSSPPSIGKVPASQVATLAGETIDMALPARPLVVAFWATWCGPCTVELKRLQAMIDRKQIDASSVLAISAREPADVVRAAVQERKYTFQIGLDSDGAMMDRMGVSATPTIFLVKPDGSIGWSTVGLSPTLELRVASFLKPSAN